MLQTYGPLFIFTDLAGYQLPEQTGHVQVTLVLQTNLIRAQEKAKEAQDMLSTAGKSSCIW